MVEVRDPAFVLESCSIWADNLPAAATNSESQLVKADAEIDRLNAGQSKLQFDADALSLARDASMLARLHSQEQKTSRAARLARVCHLRQENQIGSSIVTNFMSKNCKHVFGPTSQLMTEVAQA